MAMLEDNQNKTALSCRCGAEAFTLTAWNVMTQDQRTAAENKACHTCLHDAKAR